jgi:hypothetical protein
MSTARFCCCGTGGPVCDPCVCSNTVYSLKWTGTLNFGAVGCDPCPNVGGLYFYTRAFTVAYSTTTVIPNNLACGGQTSIALSAPYTAYDRPSCTVASGAVLPPPGYNLTMKLEKPQQSGTPACHWIATVSIPFTLFDSCGFTQPAGVVGLVYKKLYDPNLGCTPPGALSFDRAFLTYGGSPTEYYPVGEISAQNLGSFLGWSYERLDSFGVGQMVVS